MTKQKKKNRHKKKRENQTHQKKLNKIKKSTSLPENFGFFFQNLRARLIKIRRAIK